MPTFKIWLSNDLTSALNVEGRTVAEAAEKYAATKWTFEHGEDMDLVVKDELGLESDVEIKVDFEPTFWATVSTRPQTTKAS